nr:hypothetical protein [Bacteroidota bacterium]
MKNITLIFLFLASYVLLPAQEIKQLSIVGKPKKLDNEMVARKDQNGRYCAAIQVISDLDGFAYDSFDGFVGDIEDNPGKDIVFLTPTERVLDILKTGYEPLRIVLSEIGIKLQERAMWQIKIAGDETANVLPVTFRITPEDAILFIDDKQTANESTYNLAVGKHTIRME